MLRTLVVGLVVLVLLALGGLYLLGTGVFVEAWNAGEPTERAIPRAVVEERASAQRAAAAAIEVPEPKQILFGDLHVHTTFSTDAFLMSLPLNGGNGAHPVGDACDFARYCSALDFWSINDHAITLTPTRWSQTVEAMRQCDAVSGDPARPDVVPFLGWEWTQIGTHHRNHYGHKNVVLRGLEENQTPTRPIMAGPPPGTERLTAGGPNPFALGLLALLRREGGGLQIARYLTDMSAVPICPEGVPVRDLSNDCREQARTPGELFAKLDDWAFDSMVIPHGTTWGYYSPPAVSWDKQLSAAEHDPERQVLVEVYSGHGNSEEYRPWTAATVQADGSLACPEESDAYLPSCQRAADIIRTRCIAEGGDDCEARAAEARKNYLGAGAAGLMTVPGTKLADWRDSGQCRDCFQPAFNYRPRSSVQYMMALRNLADPQNPLRFRFGFIASSDNHSARPGTGYKEYARTEMTEARFKNFVHNMPGAAPPNEAPSPRSVPFDRDGTTLPIFAMFETERSGSFFLSGGLVAAHASGRDRDSVWNALQGREVYGTSGPRILLWFDLLDTAPDGATVRRPMGAGAQRAEAPRFEVRAVGSFEQKPGCPEYSQSAVAPERLQRLCMGECYNPSDQRRPITRIEVIRIHPQVSPDESVAGLVEDPWRSFACEPDPAGCTVRFSDTDFVEGERDVLYYVRAIEAPSLAVDADPLRCERDGSGRCLKLRPCADLPTSDDCLGETEQRAWSSPIFVDWVPAS